METSEDPLAKFGLEAIDLRWTLKDIIGKRWILAPPKPDHVRILVELGLVEVQDGEPFVTSAGRDAAWL